MAAELGKVKFALMKDTHSLDGQHQYTDRIPHRKIILNDRGQTQIPWCGQPLDREWLKK